MNKILVEIMLPAAEQTWDVLLPPDSKLTDITKLLVKMFSDLADGKYKPVQINLLCDGETGHMLDMNRSPAELGIRNGDRLLLI